jgi:NitT/TauT family transport system substrate-binding protein
MTHQSARPAFAVRTPVYVQKSWRAQELYRIVTKRRNIMPFVHRLILGLASALALATGAQAQETNVRFTLDWKIQGIHAWYYYAEDKGYFAAEKIKLQIDQGEGSGVTVSRIMGGAYDAGFGDMGAIIQNAAQKPGEQPVMVYQIYNQPPFALVTRVTSGITSLKDIEGRTLGSPSGSIALRLFTPLMKLNGLDPEKVKVLNMAPNLQETMLLQNQVDVIAGFSVTSYMNIVAQKLDPDKDFRWFYFGDYGLDLYSNGVMVSQKLLKEKPETVKGLVKAINRAIRECAAQPDPCIAALAKAEPLINKDVEKRRMMLAFQKQMLTKEADALGLGDIDDKRLTATVNTVAEAFALPRKPELTEVFSRVALPPKAERTMKLVTN